jgi:hypothetical protein
MARIRSGQSRINLRLVGAGTAGIAAVFAVAPFAGAATPSPSPTPSAAPHHLGAGKVKAPAPNAETTTSTAPAPDFGIQKFRIGVQIKSGAYVPEGTTTAGSEVTIVETGPNAPDTSTTCTTVADTEVPPSTETYCQFPVTDALRRAARAHHLSQANVAALDPTDYYTAEPGDTVTLTQTTVEPNLVIDSVEQTRPPVVADDSCDFGFVCTTDPVTFTDPGLPPVAVDDHSTTKVNTPVDIDVTSNDDPKGAPTSISVTSQPSNGKAALVGGIDQQARQRAGSGTQTIEYTPKSGFVGHDEFTYTLTTANGSSLAHVFVTIKAPPPTAVDDSASTTTGVPVTIAETTNDDANGGGALTVKSVGDPHHGTVRVDGKKTIYTSDADFTGKDTYVYTISTAYGTATATVTVTVAAPASSPTPSPSRSDQPLAVTGVPTATLGELGLGLLAVGGAATVVGRRRRRGNHA